MVSLQIVEEQLKRLGCNFRFWGRAEIKELSVVLMPDEIIAQCTNGHYEGGFALLVATDRRLILVDRKPMFLTLEAISYDMISQVDFNHRLMDATLHIFTFNKCLDFTSWNHKRLRTILAYTQDRMANVRQQQYLTPQTEPEPYTQRPAYGALSAAAPASFSPTQVQPQSPWIYRRKTPMMSHESGLGRLGR